MQIGYTAVMARLLNPADFGLVAMGGVVLNFGNYFAQMGMGSAIVQKKEITKEQISAAFTSSIFLGFVFSLLAFLLAPLAIFVFKNQGVVPLLRLMGLAFLLNGFSLTALALIRRELKFKALAIAEIISFVIGYPIIGIGSAIAGFGVWSLVFASLTQNALIAIITFFIIKHKLSLSISWKHYKPLLSFGSRVSIISFLEFVGSSLDTILIGRFFGSNLLGIYNRAQMLINLPMQYFTSSFSRVLFPSFSRIQDDNERVKRNILLILRTVSMVIFPFAIIVAVLSKEIVEVLLGARWLEAASLLKVLSFAAAVDLLTHFIAVLFEAKGLLKQKIIIQGTFVIVLAISFYFALRYGLFGFACALLVCQTFRQVFYMFFFLRKFEIGLLETFRDYLFLLVSCLAIFVPTYLMHWWIAGSNMPSFAIIGLTLLPFAGVYALVLNSKNNAQMKNEIISRLRQLRV